MDSSVNHRAHRPQAHLPGGLSLPESQAAAPQPGHTLPQSEPLTYQGLASAAVQRQGSHEHLPDARGAGGLSPALPSLTGCHRRGATARADPSSLSQGSCRECGGPRTAGDATCPRGHPATPTTPGRCAGDTAAFSDVLREVKSIGF